MLHEVVLDSGQRDAGVEERLGIDSLFRSAPKTPAVDECLAIDDDGEKFKTFEEMERSYTIEALKRCNWQVRE